MPTYDYLCEACNNEFEEYQSFSDKQLTKCPKCGKKKLRRLFGTGAGVIFKGSGFYETDYRSDSYKQAAKADQEKGASSTGDGKKPAAEKTGTDGTASSASDAAPQKKSKEGGKSSKSAS
jgi:putative FmdB family regulatory protein